MDEGPSVSGISRGHQRRLYDQRRQAWAQANNLKLVVLDYRGFDTDRLGRLRRSPQNDRDTIASALRAAGVKCEPSRARFDPKTYHEQVAAGCFICRLLEGDPELPAHHAVWRNNDSVVFLSRFPTVYGYLLVAPTAHKEQVTGDFTLYEYLALQRIVHATAEAVRAALRPERVYVLSLGSQQANSHVHWHIVPCPPGTPLEEQQLAMLDAERRGVLRLTEDEAATLASLIRTHLPRPMRRQDGDGP
jgi:diadenosine tetraphosphate (Ap4A) HIT family hydrolase